MIIQGIAHWAKIVGEPQPGYDKSKKEWSLDLEVNADTKELLTKVGLGHKVKMVKSGEYEYITFKRPELKSDGKPSKPIRIAGPDTKPWSGAKIGNGSVLNVSFVVNEVPYQGKIHKKPGIIAVQVVKHVPHESGDEFEAVEVEVDTDGNEDWSNA